MTPPDIVFVFADEWRAQAVGYAGDANAATPAIDGFSRAAVDVALAVSGSPICCPYRASLMTGRYPLRHGVFINDVELDPACDSVARVLGRHGYESTYIGKWHLYGSPDGAYGRRRARVPRSHQLGFGRWMGFECTHDYWDSPYFVDDEPEPRVWAGYDAEAQTAAACAALLGRRSSRPQLLMLSWGPPHFPLATAPALHRDRYAARAIALPPNVPPARRAQAEAELRGYYAHIAALDDCFAQLLAAIAASGRERDTIVVLTGDHGEMRWCQDVETKFYPFDESIRVPFLVRWPAGLGDGGRRVEAPLDAPDILPTLLGLCGLPPASQAEGRDWSPELRGERLVGEDAAALLGVHASLTELRWDGVDAWRGLRTPRWSYVREARGPWLLHDMRADPFQLRNLIEDPGHAAVRDRLDAELARRLAAVDDRFEPGAVNLRRAGLAHYREVSFAPRRTWRSPWGDDPAWRRVLPDPPGR